MEKQILREKIEVAYSGAIATREILEGYIGKPRISFIISDLDSKTILDKYVADCLKYGWWRTKRQVSGSKSETPAGWKICKDAATNILAAQPHNERGLELLKAAVVYNRLSSMISTIKAELKNPPTPTSAPGEPSNVLPVYLPQDCPATTIWDYDAPLHVFPVVERALPVSHYRAQISAILARITGKESKANLLNIIEQVKALA